MGDDRPILLLTRPEAASLRFRDLYLNRFGADRRVVISPLMEIVHLDAVLPDAAPDAIVFGSENAVAAYARLTADRSPIAWCVGPRTVEVARAAGFRTREGPGDIAALGRALCTELQRGIVLYARPVHATGGLSDTLVSGGIETISIVLYDQRARPLTGEARAVANGAAPVILPLFSQRSAAIASTALAGARARISSVAISAAADVAFTAGSGRRLIAAEKTSQSMLDAISELIERR